MQAKNEYRAPRIVTLEAREVVASLGPAAAGGSMLPSASQSGPSGTTWGGPTGSPMG
jgi:hypothetical protein